MKRYEYKVIPAPSKGRKAPGVKKPEARFAHGLELVMNEMGAEGWEYQRSDILPSEERQGLTSSHTVYRSVLIFRRMLAEDELAIPVAGAAVAEDAPEDAALGEVEETAAQGEIAADEPERLIEAGTARASWEHADGPQPGLDPEPEPEAEPEFQSEPEPEPVPDADVTQAEAAEPEEEAPRPA